MKKMAAHGGFRLENRHIYAVVFFTALAALLLWLLWPQIANTVSGAASNKTLARCLTEKGVVMYGVDTCTHCIEQKEMFGKDFADINYVNCDFNQKSCHDRGITFYPVWSFGNSVLVGTQSLQTLADFAECEL